MTLFVCRLVICNETLPAKKMAAAMEQTSSTSSASEMEEEYEVEKIVGVCESKVYPCSGC